MTGADATYQTSFFNAYSNILQNTPIFPTPGNHDGGASSAYWNIFALPYQGQAGGFASGHAHYYSFDYANIHFISLDAFNTSTDVGSPMLTWLTNDLASNTQAWTIAYWHAPVYCKVFYDSDTVAQCVAMRQNFVPLLESYGVDLILNGHSHSLQRTYLLNRHYGVAATFNPTNKVDGGNGREDGTGAYLKPGRVGTVYAVAPTGCGFTRSGSSHPACLFTLNNTAGFIVLDVNSNRLDFKMVTSAGAIGDYFTILKGASQGAPPAMPAALAAVASGSSANLTWNNNATNEVSYLLERSINGAPFEGIAVIGANLTTFTNVALDFANAYYYRLRAWNNAGYSDYSEIASLTPAEVLAIDLQPQNTTILPGGAASFTVLARGAAPIAYQWYHAGTIIPGQTNATLRLLNVTSNDAGQYAVVLANGATPLVSETAWLTVTTAITRPVLVGSPQFANGVFTVTFHGMAGANYTIQYTDAINAAGWNYWTNITVSPSGAIQWQDYTTGVPQRFYRLVSP
jgi:hypothetical protein